MDDPVLGIGRYPGGLLSENLKLPRPVIGVNRFEERHPVFVEALTGSAPYLLVGRTHIQDIMFPGIEDPEYLAACLRQPAEPILALDQCLFGSLPLGDVGCDSIQTNERSASVECGFKSRFNPSQLPVGADDPELMLDALSGG